MLALGLNDLALLLGLAHALFRIDQFVNQCGVIKDRKKLYAKLDGFLPWWTPTKPPMWVYILAWRLRRFDRDLMELPRSITGRNLQTIGVSGTWQNILVFLVVALAALPELVSGLIPGMENDMMVMMIDYPIRSTIIFLAHALLSIVLIRWLFHRVLDVNRFLFINIAMTKYVDQRHNVANVTDRSAQVINVTTI